jgi:hypothetical protein
LGDNDNDFPIIDNITNEFEAVLGRWAGRQDWPFSWLSAPPQLKVFGLG